FRLSKGTSGVTYANVVSKNFSSVQSRTVTADPDRGSSRGAIPELGFVSGSTIVSDARTVRLFLAVQDVGLVSVDVMDDLSTLLGFYKEPVVYSTPDANYGNVTS